MLPLPRFNYVAIERQLKPEEAMSIVKAAKRAQKMGVTFDDFMGALSVFGLPTETTKRRRRRTKAEMEEARNGETVPEVGSVPDPVEARKQRRARKARSRRAHKATK